MSKEIEAALISAIGVILTAIVTTLLGSDKSKKILLGVVLIIGVGAGAFVYRAVENTPRVYPSEDGLISAFSGPGLPVRNRMGEVFTIVTDSEWWGQSTCYYKLQSETNIQGEDQTFMRLFFKLMPQSTDHHPESYVGVFTNFSYPPAKPFDV